MTGANALPTIDMTATGERIKGLMEENGYTPSRLQKVLGLSCVQTIYRWFDGTNLPTVDTLVVLADLFCIAVDDILVVRKDGTRKGQVSEEVA